MQWNVNILKKKEAQIRIYPPIQEEFYVVIKNNVEKCLGYIAN